MGTAVRKAPKVEAIVAYCRAVFQRTGQTPSYSMIRDELRMTDNATVRGHVRVAVARGWLELNDDYRGGRGPRGGQRIRLGRPEDRDTVKIKMGRDL